jgi:Ca-activated chloride channel family protein
VFCFLLFAANLILALAEPHWGYRQVPEFRRGEDVVLAFDLSRSMEVPDVLSPGGSVSRLDRALALARELVKALSGLDPGEYAGTAHRTVPVRRVLPVRFAVAAGKGMGILTVPLTDDTEAVLGFLEGLSSSTVTGRGTNLESLANAAAGAFTETFPTRRRIILFSDGEGLSGSFIAAVEELKEANITISAVGLGTEAGGPVPLNEGQGYLLGEDGLPVYSFLRAEILRNAAEQTGGIYIEGSREDAAALLAGHLDLRPAEGAAAGFKTEPENRRHIFILLAIGALGIGKLTEKRRRTNEHL